MESRSRGIQSVGGRSVGVSGERRKAVSGQRRKPRAVSDCAAFLRSGDGRRVFPVLMQLMLCWPLLAGARPDSGSLPSEDTLAVVEQIRENEARLGQTRQELARVRSELDRLAGEESAVLAKVSKHDQEIALVRRYLNELTAQVRVRTLQIAALATEARELAAELDARQAMLGRRLVAMYKYGRTLPLEAMLSTRTLPEVCRRMTYLRWFVRQDEQLARELGRLADELQAKQMEVAAARENLARLQEEQRQQETVLQAARASAVELLRKVRSDKSERERLAVELEQSAQKLKTLLSELERRREQARGTTGQHFFELNRGKLSWPLAGRVVTGFGAKVNPRYGTRTTSLGIDISPQRAAGSEQLAVATAVAAGRVVYADQFMGYGNLVIVDHEGGFFTLYANLTEMMVKVGDLVAAGTSVGRVDDYLHFELRRDGKPLDPIPWLARR